MSNPLVLQSDFGLADGAVSAMVGVALCEDKSLSIHHPTHDIAPYNIFEASCRLFQTIEYWPAGTVFVSVVDPGMGCARKPVVAKKMKNQYIVTPDNGALSFIKTHIGISEIREISETEDRQKETEHSYTSNGRDVYAYIGAKLASGSISFEGIGQLIDVDNVVELPTAETEITEDAVKGNIDILDVRFGSLWTSIEREELFALAPKFGDRFEVSIYNNETLVYQDKVIYGKSFADVHIGQPIIYVNSLYRISVAINQGSFAKAYDISAGQQWRIEFRRP